MEHYKLGEMEQRFADIIWENAPDLTNGKDISMYNKEEQEVVYKRNSKFYIKDKVTNWENIYTDGGK